MSPSKGLIVWFDQKLLITMIPTLLNNKIMSYYITVPTTKRLLQ